MQIEPSELTDRGYKLLDKLEHDDLIPFVQQAMRFKNRYTYTYHAILFLFFLILIVFYFYLVSKNTLSWNMGLAAIMMGITLPFLTIPLHELIHMLAYKVQGAPKTTLYSNFRKFYFAALADQFVVNRKEFIRIALAPFFILLLFFAAPIFFTRPLFQLTLLAALFVHIATCSGDFALLSYFAHHADKDLLTFDDAPNKLTYFYAKPT